MIKEKLFPSQDRDQLADRVRELQKELALVPAVDLANRTGTVFQETGEGRGVFKLEYWEQELEVSYPDFKMIESISQAELGPFDQLMLAYYFNESDGTPLSGQWISFSDLPDGKFYAQAFEGYSSGPLLKTFGHDIDRFSLAARRIGGQQPWIAADLGDSAAVFKVLAQISLLAVCWLGDEDFPSSYRILFDSNISHHLTTDACAILGSNLSRRLVNANEEDIFR